MKKNIAVILDGRKTNRKKIIHHLLKSLDEAFEFVFYHTEHNAHAISLTQDIAKKNYDYLLVAGGDGLLNEVINGCMLYQNELAIQNNPNIRIGILPMGSGNDFSRTIGMHANIETLKNAIVNDEYIESDVGIVNFIDTSGKETQRYFINITDAGMGGMVVEKIDKYSRKINSHLNYQRAIISTFLTYKKKHVHILADNFTYEGHIMNLIVANGKYFGNGLCIAPDAKPDDGQLSIVILGNITLWDYLKNFKKLTRCKKILHPQVFYHKVTEIQMNSAEQIPIDMDGEFIGYTPIKIKLAPTKIKILCEKRKNSQTKN